MATSTIGRAAAERAAVGKHIEGCAECGRSLAYLDLPFKLCATGEALWDRYQEAKMMGSTTRAEFAFDHYPDGRIVVHSLDELSREEALAAHNWLGTHVLGCHDARLCGCVQYGLDMGREAKHEPLR